MTRCSCGNVAGFEVAVVAYEGGRTYWLALCASCAFARQRAATSRGIEPLPMRLLARPPLAEVERLEVTA